jgi:thiol:disulfide interchange protein
MNHLILLAQRGADSPANKWLNDNPLVLGLIALAIGVALVGFGLYELSTGVSRDKYGNEIKGGLGKFASVLRIVLGAGACLFGLYKMVAG